jgi:hypothetical protein
MAHVCSLRTGRRLAQYALGDQSVDVASGAVYEMVERVVALRECSSERFAGGVIGRVELFGDKISGSVRLRK